MEVFKDIEWASPKYKIGSEGTLLRNDGFIKKPCLDRDGYLTTSICGRRLFIHRIVAIAFIENHLNKAQVNHINGVKTDNRVCNLEWATSKENINHAIDIGLNKIRGETNCFAKLTKEQVVAIRQKGKYGTFRQIAKDNGMSSNAIVQILKRFTWRHI